MLGRYVGDEGVLDLPTAIHRMTGMPAAKFRLADRGAVRPGAFADLVVFDPARIRDTATYDDPKRFPDGIRAVYFNGVAVARDGAHTGARPGRGIRRASAPPGATACSALGEQLERMWSTRPMRCLLQGR